MHLNDTHDPAATSWLASANGSSDFPIQNLPFGVFRRIRSAETFRCGVAVGDQILDLAALSAAGVFKGSAADALACCDRPHLNALMGLGSSAASELRAALFTLLRIGSAAQSSVRSVLIPQGDVEMALPATIGDYTDFYTSIHHATAVGKQFRPDNPLLPNYKWVPIGYHGRASSIQVSGHSFVRPRGQLMLPGEATPRTEPARRLDYELEVGIFVGRGNALGTSISIDSAEAHVFGLCLLNDWSARDIQAWEYQPLGPFLAKNFATTISPWVVTLEALAPFRLPWTRVAEDPQPLPYLDNPTLRAAGAIDVTLEAFIDTARMRDTSMPMHRLSRSSFKHSYWSVSQLIAHHTINGCNLQPGDLLGSGTQSGPTPEEAGSLLELSQGGKQAIQLPSGEQRTFLEDGDRVTFRGSCERDGFVRIGFGGVSATVEAASARR
jgi:fumarylacetoacetase